MIFNSRIDENSDKSYGPKTFVALSYMDPERGEVGADVYMNEDGDVDEIERWDGNGATDVSDTELNQAAERVWAEHTKVWALRSRDGEGEFEGLTIRARSYERAAEIATGMSGDREGLVNLDEDYDLEPAVTYVTVDLLGADFADGEDVERATEYLTRIGYEVRNVEDPRGTDDVRGNDWEAALKYAGAER